MGLNNTYMINGENFSCAVKEPVLNDLVEIFLKRGLNAKKNIAVAVNDVLVEKWKWKKRKINQDDKIEIVTPFFGG